jgi:hypothetical protein
LSACYTTRAVKAAPKTGSDAQLLGQPPTLESLYFLGEDDILRLSIGRKSYVKCAPRRWYDLMVVRRSLASLERTSYVGA